ncbi:hypothetical protein ABW20_dc0101606 [Dactylellina cionopaga]|nr:hypothetical protein ABW20_dc0101606 [Dactylellina cionopaga]
MQTQSRLLFLITSISYLINFGSAVPTSLSPREAPPPTPKRGDPEVHFTGPDCQLGIWQHTKRSFGAGQWEGYPLADGFPESQCVDVAALGDNLSDQVSSVEVRGNCECEFFKDHACTGNPELGGALYDRAEYDIWLNMYKDVDNMLNSWRCKAKTKEFKRCDVEVFHEEYYGGVPYDPAGGQRIVASTEAELGCKTLDPNVKGQVSSYIIEPGCTCTFYDTENCDESSAVKFSDGNLDMKSSKPTLDGMMNNSIKSLQCFQF